MRSSDSEKRTAPVIVPSKEYPVISVVITVRKKSMICILVNFNFGSSVLK